MVSYQSGLGDHECGSLLSDVDVVWLTSKGGHRYRGHTRGAPEGGWSRKQKRAFHRIMSGLSVAQRQHKDIRFLTLTSSNDAPSFEDHNDSFRKLKQKIQDRTTPAKLFHGGYISYNDIRRYYPNKGMQDTLEFSYFKVHTSEGNGVFHVLFKGDYIPQRFIQDWWKRVHNTWNVNIKSTWGDKKRVAGYVAGQYLADQDAGYTRYSWCHSWLFPGAIAKWKYFKKWYRRGVITDLLAAWNRWIEHEVYGGQFPSITLDDYG